MTNDEHFGSKVVEYRAFKDLIQKTDVCIIGELGFSDILVSKKENVAIIKLGQALQNLLNANGSGCGLDIANRGYPAALSILPIKMSIDYEEKTHRIGN